MNGKAADVLFAVSVGLLWLSLEDPPVLPANRPIEIAKEGFAGSASCRACHPGSYESWHSSFHRSMTQVAGPNTIITKMDGLRLSHNDVDYQVDRDGDRFFITSKAANAPADAPATRSEIVLLTGSHHLQIFWGESPSMGRRPTRAGDGWQPLVPAMPRRI